MAANVIIRRIEAPTDWVHSLAIVVKKEKGLQLCIDLRELSKNTIRKHFYLPTRKYSK